MPKTCFSVGCKTGYSKNRQEAAKSGEKIPSLFKAPKDAVLFEKWKKAIPRADRELSLNDHVCALHFNETDIDTHYEVKLSDGTIWREERQNHILKKGAVPCRFPNLPHYLSNPRKRRKSPIKREPLQVRDMNLDLPFPPVMDNNNSTSEIKEAPFCYNNVTKFAMSLTGKLKWSSTISSNHI